MKAKPKGEGVSPKEELKLEREMLETALKYKKLLRKLE